MSTPGRHPSPHSPLIESTQTLEDVAARIVKRTLNGAPHIAAELILRELTGARPERRFGLAFALAEEAIATAAQPRAVAIARGLRWVPALHDTTTGRLVTSLHDSATAAGLTVRILDAMHRHTAGEDDAIRDLSEVYEIALLSDQNTFFGVFQGLVQYAVEGQRGDLQVTLD